MALLQFHERRLAEERYQDLLGELFSHEGTERLNRLHECVQVLECRILEGDRQSIHWLNSWPLDIIQVFAIDFRQVREDSQKDLVEVLKLGLLRAAHQRLVIFVLQLVEGVLIEAEGRQVQWTIPLDRLQYAGESRQLVERDIELTELLTALQRVDIRNGALRS